MIGTITIPATDSVPAEQMFSGKQPVKSEDNQKERLSIFAPGS
jgi:hypothetical protein